MSRYRRNKNRITPKKKSGYETNQVSGRDYAEGNTKQPEVQERYWELAEVIDVIRSSDHPDYTVNEDIGKAKVRRTVSEFNRDAASLGYAHPIKSRFKDFPLEYELVVVTKLNSKPYYFQTANWKTNPNQNSAANLSINKTESGSGGNVAEAQAGIAQSSGGGDIDIEGADFDLSTKIKPLRHRAGDTVVEGRFGNSIRLGRDGKMNPIMQLRVGQRSDVESAEYLTPFFEHINDDPSSIYLTDEPVEFPLDPEGTSPELEPTTIDFGDHLFSAETGPDAYNKAQILEVSNRIVMDAKKRQIQGFSQKDTNWVTNSNFTVDAKQRIKTLSINGHLHISESYFDVLPEGNIHLATEDENEPVARGQQTHDRFVETLQTLQIETHPTPCGPTGPPNQSGTYAQIEQKVRDTVRSEKIFVDNVGEKVSREMSPASE